MSSRPHNPAPWLGHPRARHLLVACGLLAGLVLALGTALLIVQARQSQIANAERELQNLSLVLSEKTDEVFHGLELVQSGLIEHLREQGIDTAEKFDHDLATLDTHLDLRRRIASMPHIGAIALISRDGHIVSISRTWPVPHVDLSDRDYLQALTRHPGQASYIGGPFRERIDGSRTVLLAHALTGPDGKLIGIVTTGLELDLLEGLFTRIAVGKDTTFALLRSDGVLLAGYPHVDGKLGQSYGARPEFDDLRGSLDRGIVTRAGIVDGRMRMIAPRSIEHFPLIQLTSNTVEAALAQWRGRASWTAGIALVAELVIGGIVLLGVRQARAQEQVVAAYAATREAETARTLAETELALSREREASERASRLQSQRFDIALSNMLQGLVMCDAAGRLLVVNQRFVEMFGQPADAGYSIQEYTEMVDLMAACSNVAPDDLAALCNWRQTAIAEGVRAVFTWEMSDGRTLTVTHQPMPDGWLATYEDITESRRADLRMAYMAQHDALTDLPNRILFHEKLQEAMAHARRGRPLALLFLDLDQFKAVNDTLGHPVGDGLLQAVALRLRQRMRDTDTVARLGGDEFAIVLAPIGTPGEVTDVAERLIAMLEEPFQVADHQIVISTSIGIAFAPQDGQDADQLQKSADLALYRAKLEGRGVCRLFQAEMDAQMQARRLLEVDLRNALHSNELELFYQPLIDLRARSVAGFEALLRWRHKSRGIISPDKFIPLAEEVGAIVPIGEWVLRRACIAAVAWPDGLKVAVNLSPAQFKSRNLVAAVAAALAESGLSPARLELEITETVMLQDTAATLATLHELRGIGVSIAMDDFGTGYSSLSYLRQFPFDRIKIDQSFVRELSAKRDCGAIVRAVTTLSRELGMATTAEGVETQEQLTALALAGCTDVQGFLFSRPVPEPAVAELLRTMPSIKDMLPPGTVTEYECWDGARRDGARWGGPMLHRPAEIAGS